MNSQNEIGEEVLELYYLKYTEICPKCKKDHKFFLFKRIDKGHGTRLYCHDCYLKDKFVLKSVVKEKIDELLVWGNNEEDNNNIYRKGNFDLNEDWIDKLEKLRDLLNSGDGEDEGGKS